MLPGVTGVALCTPISCIRRTLLHGCCRRWSIMPIGSRDGSRCSQMWWGEMCCWTWFKAVGGARAVHWLPVDQCGWHCDKESAGERPSTREREIERVGEPNRTLLSKRRYLCLYKYCFLPYLRYALRVFFPLFLLSSFVDWQHKDSAHSGTQMSVQWTKSSQ